MTEERVALGFLMQPYGAGREGLLRIRVNDDEQAAIHALRRSLGLDNASDTVRVALAFLELARTEAPDLVRSLMAVLGRDAD